jgi:hypothetical protein
MFVRRTDSFSSKDIHRALFPSHAPKPKAIDELREGIRSYVRKRYAYDSPLKSYRWDRRFSS